MLSPLICTTWWRLTSATLLPRLAYPARTLGYFTTSGTRPASCTSRYSRCAACIVVDAGLAYGLDREFNASAIGRNLRTLWTRLTIAVEYKLKFTPEKADQIPALQERVAGRVYDLTSSGGHYINKDRVYIPHIFPELSTKKITTAEWIDGVRLSDKHGISLLMGDDRASASSTDPLPADRFPLLRGGAKWVMQTMINLFSAQIFDWGWVHCDPHPGNVIVRPHSDPRRAAHGAAQLVLLDHGLYVRLPREFQQQYARLWKALLTVDFAAVSAVAGEWGIGAPDLFASATLMRPIRFAEQAPLPDFERMNDYERWVVMKAKQADVDRNIFCLQR